MCVDDYDGPHIPIVRPRACRRFIIEDEEEISHTYYVNISLFEEENEEVALCRILFYLSNKGLIVNNRKFYLPKFKVIIQPFTFCKVKFDALNETNIYMKSYSESKENNDIFL